MALRLSHKTLAWIIIGFCILAIPVKLISSRSTSLSRTERDTDSPINSLALSFEDRIQVIRLLGMIVDKESGFFPSSNSASSVIKQLRKAASNKQIKGVLLRINSPGGTIATSQELHDAVEELKKKGKPVVVSMSDVAASGGYYTACASDKIVANPGTLTGSIGVIMDLVNFKQLADKIGIRPEVIKSGQFKDIASPFRPLTAAEKDILQALIKDAYDQFTTAVAKGRKIDLETVRKLADGRVYSGRQALALKLVDKLGGYEVALDELQNLCKERYHLSKKLPVDESSGESFVSALLESSTKLGLKDISFGLLPQAFDAQFYKQPLWLMQ